MPANPKYLTHDRNQRIAKVSAAIVGGFLVSGSSMLFLATWAGNSRVVFHTYSFAMFLLWCTLMMVAFLFRSGWKCWAWYGGLTLVFVVLLLFKLNA